MLLIPSQHLRLDLQLLISGSKAGLVSLLFRCRCKYGNCKHIDDDGCAVREKWSRHAWYVELYSELEAAAAVQRARAASKKNREGNVKFKTKGGQQSMEVLLDPKKHRNVSRRQVRKTVSLFLRVFYLQSCALCCAVMCAQNIFAVLRPDLNPTPKDGNS